MTTRVDLLPPELPETSRAGTPDGGAPLSADPCAYSDSAARDPAMDEAETSGRLRENDARDDCADDYDALDAARARVSDGGTLTASAAPSVDEAPHGPRRRRFQSTETPGVDQTSPIARTDRSPSPARPRRPSPPADPGGGSGRSSFAIPQPRSHPPPSASADSRRRSHPAPVNLVKQFRPSPKHRFWLGRGDKWISAAQFLPSDRRRASTAVVVLAATAGWAAILFDAEFTVFGCHSWQGWFHSVSSR